MKSIFENYNFNPARCCSSPIFVHAGFRGTQMGEVSLHCVLPVVGAELPRSERSSPATKHRAGELRKASTPAEVRLWSRLRNDQLGVTFRRQHAIGKYIPDFCSPKGKLVIELDGSQHLDREKHDAERTLYLES